MTANGAATEQELDTFVLASFCNLPQNQPTLGVLDGRTLGFAYAPLADLPPCNGVTGMTANDRYVYAVVHNASESGRSALLALERQSFAVAALTDLSIPRDAHSVFAREDIAYVVSTGTDEVVALRLDGPAVLAEEIVWRPPEAREREDTHHLNAISESVNRLVVSGFGPKKGEDWTSARNGFVWDIETGEVIAAPIYHPHSVTEVTEGLLGWCASGSRQIELLDGRSSGTLPGYARGLCTSQGLLFAATSKRRHTSKLKRAFTGLGRSGRGDGSCAIVRLDQVSLELEASLELPGGVAEIYDLLSLELPRSKFDELVAASASAPGPPRPRLERPDIDAAAADTGVVGPHPMSHEVEASRSYGLAGVPRARQPMTRLLSGYRSSRPCTPRWGPAGLKSSRRRRPEPGGPPLGLPTG